MDPYHASDDASVSGMSVGSIGVDTEVASENQTVYSEKRVNDDGTEKAVLRETRQLWCTKFFLFLSILGAGIFISVEAKKTGDDIGDPDANLHAGVAGACFGVVLLLFLRYDYLVSRRQSIVLDMAKKSRSIVDSLFPSVVRDRLLQASSQPASNSPHGSQHDLSEAGVTSEMDFEELTRRNTQANKKVSESAPIPIGVQEKSDAMPIADLFANTTIFFADVAGFTAWSSEREPAQVFMLLERVYGEFDKIAAKLGVFKVETIGDSYMAVTGLPEPTPDHAINMARFAYQCVVKMSNVVDELVPSLGPGTEELHVRIGLHSGPVTAGVLRGDKSRFQLFGDTVNTASRMESTGVKGRIQISQETADLLVGHGKAHWLKPREDLIVAKGKGEMRTYWLDPHKNKRGSDAPMTPTATPNASRHSIIHDLGSPMKDSLRPPIDTASPRRTIEVPKTLVSGVKEEKVTEVSSGKYKRLIDWNTDVLMGYVQDILTKTPSSRRSRAEKMVDHANENPDIAPPFESVAELILLPPFDPYSGSNDIKSEEILGDLRSSVRDYVATIASMYNNVPFHNFEHASHVTLAAQKLVKRMTTSKTLDESELYNRSYGISADPITQFAIVFGAMIHDVGHSGIPNAQLVYEEQEVARKYKNRSVAEQNSVHLAWAVLMEPRFMDFRRAIYRTNIERKRFRQVLTNTIMATDIADREVNQLRSKKWNKAFVETDVRGGELMTHDEINRKATVVIESIIQMADVAHTMQHWHIYRRWNERLFIEMTAAYRARRASFDPSGTWYDGEIGFFEHYIIPLAEKLNKSGVFGSGGKSYIQCARENQQQWKEKGKEAVRVMIANLEGVAAVEAESDDEDSIMEEETKHE